MLPCECGIVCPVEGIADFVVIDDSVAYFGNAVVPDGIGILQAFNIACAIGPDVVLAQQVATGVVSIENADNLHPVHRRAIHRVREIDRRRIFLGQQLIQTVVGVGDRRAVGVRDFGNIPRRIILVADGFALVDIVLDAAVGGSCRIAPFSGGRRGPPLRG